MHVYNSTKELGADEFARSTRAALVDTGGRFMTAPEMDAAGHRVGLPGPVLYFRGRIGVLGEVTATVASAALGIFPPPVIQAVWQQTEALAAVVAVSAYMSACHEWGRHHLRDLSDAGALVAAAERIVDGADVSALLLIAAWRERPRAEDLAARTAQAIMLLRELRGGLHFCALRTEGLEVPIAVLADPSGGPDRLRRTAWSAEAADALQARADAVPELHARWQRAEAATDAALARCAEALSPAERGRLSNLLSGAEQISRGRVGRDDRASVGSAAAHSSAGGEGPSERVDLGGPGRLRSA
jgi:hypothetical protein